MLYQRLWLVIIAAPVLAGFAAGCAQASPQAQPDTRAVNEQAIRQSKIARARAYAAKNVDRIVAQYADDGSSMVPGAPMMTGIAAIRTGVIDQLADPKFALSFHPDKIEVSESGDTV